MVRRHKKIFAVRGESDKGGASAAWTAAMFKCVGFLPVGGAIDVGGAIVFAPDSKNLFMASHHGSVKKYDITNGKLVRQYAEEVNDLSSLAVSPNGKQLMLATEKEILMWDTESGRSLAKFNPGIEQEINETTFTNNNNKLIITSNNNTAIDRKSVV